ARGRLDAGHEQGVADPGVEQDLGTQLLDHLDAAVEAVVGGVGRPGDMDVLGADAERGLTAELGARTGRDLGRQDDLEARRLAPPAPPRPPSSLTAPWANFPPGEPMKPATKRLAGVL